MSVPKLETLQLGRALAAIAVVVYHASLASDAFTNEQNTSFFEWGVLGVDYFFILSGFIIFSIHREDSRSTTAALRFLRKRMIRIYIPYLPISILLILAYNALPSLSATSRDWGLLTSLTLIPTTSPPALSVAWTLTYEMIFYVFFLTFYATKGFKWIVFIWLIVVVANYFWPFDADRPLNAFFSHLLNPVIILFILGIAIAEIYARVSKNYWWIATGFGLCAILFAFLPGSPTRAALGVAFAMIILSGVMLETKYQISLPRWPLILGNASYAIYLIHNPVQSLVARAFAWSNNWIIVFVLCTLFGILSGLIYHFKFEIHALRWLYSSRKLQ